MRQRTIEFALLLFLSSVVLASSLRPVLVAITNEDLADPESSSSSFNAAAGDSESPDGAVDWDEFGDPEPPGDGGFDDDYDRGSWFPVIESSSLANSSSDDPREALYYSGVRQMIAAASTSEPSYMEIAAAEIEAAASAGFPHAQSTLGFLYGTGLMRPQNRPKSFLYHHFAAEGGNLQSKMVLAYTYFRQDMYEKAVKLYAELAEAAVASFLISKEPPVIEPVRIHIGAEENKEALRKVTRRSG